MNLASSHFHLSHLELRGYLIFMNLSFLICSTGIKIVLDLALNRKVEIKRVALFSV